MNAYLKAYLEARDYNAITDACIAWIRDWFRQIGRASCRERV